MRERRRPPADSPLGKLGLVAPLVPQRPRGQGSVQRTQPTIPAARATGFPRRRDLDGDGDQTRPAAPSGGTGSDRSSLARERGGRRHRLGSPDDSPRSAGLRGRVWCWRGRSSTARRGPVDAVVGSHVVADRSVWFPRQTTSPSRRCAASRCAGSLASSPNSVVASRRAAWRSGTSTATAHPTWRWRGPERPAAPLEPEANRANGSSRDLVLDRSLQPRPASQIAAIAVMRTWATGQTGTSRPRSPAGQPLSVARDVAAGTRGRGLTSAISTCRRSPSTSPDADGDGDADVEMSGINGSNLRHANSGPGRDKFRRRQTIQHRDVRGGLRQITDRDGDLTASPTPTSSRTTLRWKDNAPGERHHLGRRTRSPPRPVVFAHGLEAADRGRRRGPDLVRWQDNGTFLREPGRRGPDVGRRPPSRPTGRRGWRWRTSIATATWTRSPPAWACVPCAAPAAGPPDAAHAGVPGAAPHGRGRGRLRPRRGPDALAARSQRPERRVAWNTRRPVRDRGRRHRPAGRPERAAHPAAARGGHPSRSRGRREPGLASLGCGWSRRGPLSSARGRRAHRQPRSLPDANGSGLLRARRGHAGDERAHAGADGGLAVASRCRTATRPSRWTGHAAHLLRRRPAAADASQQSMRLPRDAPGRVLARQHGRGPTYDIPLRPCAGRRPSAFVGRSRRSR